MKKTSILSFCIIVFLFMLVLPVSADAADAPDTVTLHVEFPHIGTQFEVYHMATANASGTYVPTAAFKDCPVNFGSVDNPVPASQASVLESYVQLWELEPTAASAVGWSRIAHFYDLQPGLYLVVSHYITTGGKTYRAQPLSLSLPAYDKETATTSYEVIIAPKEVIVPLDSEEMLSLKALKVWDDNKTGLSHPDSVTVYLLRNGELHDTQILNAENNWTYLWEDLEGFCEWSLAEKPVPDYTVHIEKTGITYVVTNTRIPPPPPPSPSTPSGTSGNASGTATLPQTGMLWWPVPLLAAVGILLFILGWKLNRREDHAA